MENEAAAASRLAAMERCALRRVAALDGRAAGLDLPLLDYEAARVRARALLALGRLADAGRQARIALLLATDHGWLTLGQRWIQTEFATTIDLGPSGSGSPLRVSEPAGLSIGGTRSTATMSARPARGIEQRRARAVQQVSLAAATVLDPQQLARVALDETSASSPPSGPSCSCGTRPGHRRAALVPHLGRDETADLAELTGYSATLVERVATTGEPLVVTGSEEGAALGAQSAVLHGLRQHHGRAAAAGGPAARRRLPGQPGRQGHLHRRRRRHPRRADQPHRHVAGDRPRRAAGDRGAGRPAPARPGRDAAPGARGHGQRHLDPDEVLAGCCARTTHDPAAGRPRVAAHRRQRRRRLRAGRSGRRRSAHATRPWPHDAGAALAHDPGAGHGPTPTCRPPSCTPGCPTRRRWLAVPLRTRPGVGMLLARRSADEPASATRPSSPPRWSARA